MTLGNGHDIQHLSHFVADDFQDLPSGKIIKAFALAFFLLDTESDLAGFDDYSLFLDQHAGQFTEELSRELVNYAINYCIRQIRAGHRVFVQRLLDMYQNSLRQRYLHRGDGYLCPWSYKNMVKLGLGLKRFDWVDQMVEQYSDQLPTNMRSDAYHFNMADLHYHRQQYEPAIDFLNRTEFSDIHYALGARTMLTKIYYETEAYDALESLLFAFKVYLQRHRNITPETKSTYLNYVRFTHKLLLQKQLPKLREDIAGDLLLTDRNWLLLKVDEKLGKGYHLTSK